MTDATRYIVLATWALLSFLLIGCEALSIATKRRFCGVQGLLDHITKTNVRLVLALVGWMWLGWHLFAR